MSIQQLQKDLKKLLAETYTTHGYICHLYISNSINPYFICAGYDFADALENAQELDILKGYTLQELADSVYVVEEVKV